MEEERRNIRCTNGFFVARKGIVNPGEIVEVSLTEARDIIAANRGVPATAAEVKAGPMADFKPKDADGKVIAPDTRTRAQRHAAMRQPQSGTQYGQPIPYVAGG